MLYITLYKYLQAGCRRPRPIEFTKAILELWRDRAGPADGRIHEKLAHLQGLWFRRVLGALSRRQQKNPFTSTSKKVSILKGILAKTPTPPTQLLLSSNIVELALATFPISSFPV